MIALESILYFLILPACLGALVSWVRYYINGREWK